MQSTKLLQDLGRRPTQITVDLRLLGADAGNPAVEIIHHGRFKSLTSLQQRWLKRRQAFEPAIGRAKSDNRRNRCWLQGELGDALQAPSCAADYSIRWLLQAIVLVAAKRLCLALPKLARHARITVLWSGNSAGHSIVADAFGRLATAPCGRMPVLR